ncbi:hypothetical protein DFH06DRAFT_1383020 [Mycena polygramma]|nr:hypothetical protein DFH06DRAFT_1383020 [Mycena polygramma]
MAAASVPTANPPTCGMLYKLNRQLLAMKSGFFADLLNLPSPTTPSSPTVTLKVEAQKKAGLDGSSDETPLLLPENVESSDLDHLLRFIFNMTPWSLHNIHAIEELIAVLKLSHFFEVDSGTQYAIHHLSSHPTVTAPMRLYLAVTYDVDPWVAIAFKDLMKKSILDLSENDERLLGRAAYRLLFRTHASVELHRTNLAFRAPLVIHADHCAGLYTQKECVRHWEEAWFGRKGTAGMVAALLDMRLPAAALYAVLDQFYVPAMTDGCRRRTVAALEDTPTELSYIKKEDKIVDDAIQQLRALM